MTPLPVRIQLSRAKGWKMPAHTVKVDRSTSWGNPFRAPPGRQSHPNQEKVMTRSIEITPPPFTIPEVTDATRTLLDRLPDMGGCNHQQPLGVVLLYTLHQLREQGHWPPDWSAA